MKIWTHRPNQDLLIHELAAKFPVLRVRPLADFGIDGLDFGAWTHTESGAVFHDGLPLFVSSSLSEPGYDGGVHQGFTAWLDSRGWYIENYDGLTIFIVPIFDAQNMGNQKKAAA